MLKKQLRKEIMTTRMGQQDDMVRFKSEQIALKVRSLPEFMKAKTIMFYIDFRKEVITGDLISYSLANGKRALVPITDTKNIRLIPSELKDYPDDLTPGTWGIMEPKPDCVRPVDPAEIDLVIVPGVSFDVEGNRLGYGGGFYDRFLGQTRPDTVYVALAFELQMQDDVYPEAHDCPVHFVVTEERIIKADNRSQESGVRSQESVTIGRFF